MTDEERKAIGMKAIDEAAEMSGNPEVANRVCSFLASEADFVKLLIGTGGEGVRIIKSIWAMGYVEARLRALTESAN